MRTLLALTAVLAAILSRTPVSTPDSHPARAQSGHLEDLASQTHLRALPENDDGVIRAIGPNSRDITVSTDDGVVTTAQSAPCEGISFEGMKSASAELASTDAEPSALIGRIHPVDIFVPPHCLPRSARRPLLWSTG